MPSYTVKELDEEICKRLDTAFGVKNAFYEFNPGKCLMPLSHELFAQKILDFEVRKDDVWMISFPRTGSTWCQEMIWLIGNNLDFKTAETTTQSLRAPLIESSSIMYQHAETYKKLWPTDSVTYIEEMTSPRFIKSHLPLELLPSQLDVVKPKIIYTLRNPKDMVVSLYHYCNLLHNMDASFEDFCELLFKDAAPFGSVWRHYFQFWNKRHEPNVLVLKYEDMKKDVRHCLRQIADHIDKKLTDEEVEQVKDFLSFNKMRKNEGCNFEKVIEKFRGPNYCQETGKRFLRKGIVGDWKNFMSPELSQKFDRWIEANTADTDLSFEYL